jgi:hypothetical protein
VELGEMEVAGQFIQRLVMPGGPYLVILDHPAGRVKVPLGSYAHPEILLAQNGAQATCKSYLYQSPTGKWISVNSQRPALLAAGGPLTNSVIASRAGRDLRLSYQLVGVGGEMYQVVGPAAAQAPDFAVYKGNTKIASGKFEFG